MYLSSTLLRDHHHNVNIFDVDTDDINIRFGVVLCDTDLTLLRHHHDNVNLFEVGANSCVL